jgi:hypothetical protein
VRLSSGLEHDVTTEARDDSVADRQPQPGSLRFARPEGLEDVRDVGRWHAGAVVLELDDHGGVIAASGTHDDALLRRITLGRGLDRVDEQVHEELHQPRLRGHDARDSIVVAGEGRAAAEGIAYETDGRLESTLDVDRYPKGFVAACEGLQIAHDARDAQHAFAGARERLAQGLPRGRRCRSACRRAALLLGIVERALRELEARRSVGERVLHLVHHAGGERAERREALGSADEYLRRALLAHVLHEADASLHLARAVADRREVEAYRGRLVAGDRGVVALEVGPLAVERPAHGVDDLPVGQREHREPDGVLARGAEDADETVVAGRDDPSLVVVDDAHRHVLEDDALDLLHLGRGRRFVVDRRRPLLQHDDHLGLAVRGHARLHPPLHLELRATRVQHGHDERQRAHTCDPCAGVLDHALALRRPRRRRDELRERPPEHGVGAPTEQPHEVLGDVSHRSVVTHRHQRAGKPHDERVPVEAQTTPLDGWRG